MQCNNAPHTGVCCYSMHNHKEKQKFIKMDCGNHMKIISLNTNDVTNIVHRHYFHTYNARLEKNSHALCNN
jgi:hypothetical protein